MPSFKLHIPTVDGDVTHILDTGGILFVLGANGSGKSGLVSQLYKSQNQVSKLISAHRQTWFTSNTLDLTPRGREDLETNIKSQDRKVAARYRQEYAAERAVAAIYDLIDADTMLARTIADLVRDGDISAAQDKVKSPSPIQTVNELLQLSNIPIEISVEKRQKVMASRNGSAPYSVAELSDGERNAFLIAADVLTAESGTLLLIDEPERHLHRSIISPLLSLLFKKRKDCAFVVSTHEVMLPIDNPAARTLLVRSCEYENSKPKVWTGDFLPPEAPIDDDLKRDILGARKKIVFVEGNTRKSLDVPLYSILFPQVSVIPKSGCRDVEHAVRGLRAAAEMHWLHVWGIVDNDRRSKEDIERLRDLGVYALPHFSVESVYYHPEIIKHIAVRQAGVTGDDPTALYERAVTGAFQAIQAQKDHLILNVVERLVRQEIFGELPTHTDIQSNQPVEIRVDVAELRTIEDNKVDGLVAANDLEGLLTYYPLRESGALTAIARGVGLSKAKYESAVRKMLREDDGVLAYCRGLFGKLVSEIESA